MSAPALYRLKAVFIFADAARWIVEDDRDLLLRQICDDLTDRLIAAPVRSRADALVKLWLVDLAAEREWEAAYCAQPVLSQVRRFLIGALPA
ncbi:MULTISPECIES: hypothetical protein [unclassified Brevundimonas]|uniref:hypothetical protein n=1 Tax=unclassified Brevundimonas TaxID=2622653 RepID=UPI0025B7D0F8|nr:MULTISPECIES: hypothetical protein [unclassified Brevundimonas]